MNLEKIKRVYFLGIGGIGMSSLARYFNHIGCTVAGYDKTETNLTSELQKEGIEIHFSDRVDLAKKFLEPDIENTMVVYTPAIPANLEEFTYIKSKPYNCLKRAAVLGILAKNHFTIAVAGTHGKTTTSTILAHLLKHSSLNCTAFLGGIAANYQTNLLLSQGRFSESILVVEADEYDRSFLSLYPDIAIITSMDADHLDIYGSCKQMTESYNQFASQVKPEGKLIVKKNLDISKPACELLTYSASEDANYFATEIQIKKHRYSFTWNDNHKSIKELTMPLPGLHNIENATAAIAVAKILNVPDNKIEEALRSFRGVKRRFEYHIDTPYCTYIDDYAHHPEELNAVIRAVRQLYPDKKITGIFQPHLYSRTRDFMTEFAQSLSQLDTVLLLDIYPAREQPITGITSAVLLERIKSIPKKLLSKADVLEHLSQNRPEVLITLGAGDIDQLIEPIKITLGYEMEKN